MKILLCKYKKPIQIRIKTYFSCKLWEAIMASLNKRRMLFFTTSPRTPFKMIPEIELLGNNFSGQNGTNARK